MRPKPGARVPVSGRGKLRIAYRDARGRFVKPSRARSAQVTFPDGSRHVVRGRPNLAGQGTKQLVSYLLHPRQSSFEMRTQREVDAIIRAYRGKHRTKVARPRRPTWQSIYDVVPEGLRERDAIAVRVTFRGQSRIVLGTRDSIVDNILAGGMISLDETEKARLWTGPSGRYAAAQAAQVDLDDVPENFVERQSFLDDAGVDAAPLVLEVLM